MPENLKNKEGRVRGFLFYIAQMLHTSIFRNPFSIPINFPTAVELVFVVLAASHHHRAIKSQLGQKCKEPVRQFRVVEFEYFASAHVCRQTHNFPASRKITQISKVCPRVSTEAHIFRPGNIPLN